MLRAFYALTFLLGCLSQQALAQVDLTSNAIGPDRPTRGRSLFDYVFYNPDTKKIELPHSFEAIIKKIQNLTVDNITVDGVLIPKGRSLQRNAAKPDFFKFPRAVFTTEAFPRQTAADLGIFLKDRIFLGHVEKSHQIEVISYNEAEGRFEFQRVRDFPESPVVSYASRALCTSCHQNLAPIFSSEVWMETNGVQDPEHRVADRIAEARGSDQDYLGIPVHQNRQVPYNIDRREVLRANQQLIYQKLWMDSCGGLAPEAVQCRGLIVQLALENGLYHQKIMTSPAHATLQAMWDKYWPLLLPGGVALDNFHIANRDPFTQTGKPVKALDFNPSLSEKDNQELQKAEADSDIPDEFNPKFRRPKLEVWQNDASGTANRIIFAVQSSLSDADNAMLKSAFPNVAAIDKAVSKLVQMNTATSSNGQPMDDALADKPLRRGALMRGLMSAANVPTPRACCYDEAPANFPPMLLDSQIVGCPTIAGGDALELFKGYCSACHANMDPPLDFMKGTDAEMWAKIRSRAADIQQRLNWEALGSDTSGLAMPQFSNDKDSPHQCLKSQKGHRDFMRSAVLMPVPPVIPSQLFTSP